MLIMKQCTEPFNKLPGRKGNPFYPMVPGIKSIECVAEACAVSDASALTRNQTDGA